MFGTFRLGSPGYNPSMQVKNLMGVRPYTVHKNETLYVAAERMLEHRLGGLPVVGDAGELVGLLEIDQMLPDPERVPFSDVEALRFMDEWVDPGSLDKLVERYKDTPVHRLMRTEVATVGPEDPIETALALMQQDKRYRRVLVVDEKRRLLGTLTRSDFLRLFVRGA